MLALQVLCLALTVFVGLVPTEGYFVEDVVDEIYDEVRPMHRIKRDAGGYTCHAKFGKGDKQVVHRGKTSEIFTVDKYPCLKWICLGKGRIKVLKKQSGCMDRVTKKCVSYQWMNGVKCDKRICRISLRWSKWTKSWRLQYGMVTSWKKRLVTCEHDGKCYKPDEEIYNKKDCTYSKCVILPPRWPRFSRTMHWIPSRAGCIVNGVCHEQEEKFKLGCNEYQCHANVTMTGTHTATGRQYSFKMKSRLKNLASGCPKPGGGCVPLGETYKHSKCIELTCRKQGKSNRLALSREGCPLHDGSCLDVGQTKDSQCYKRTCEKTTSGAHIKFSVKMEKMSGCSNFWDTKDTKCYSDGEHIDPSDEWSKKIGCPNGALATCKIIGGKAKLSAGCK